MKQPLRGLAARFRALVTPPPPREPRHVWSIGIYTGPSLLELRPAPGVANPVVTRDIISDVPAGFVADPFMLWVAGRWHMFFEVVNLTTRKGEIGHAVSADALRWRYEGIVLTEEFHLSYPYVFPWDGALYMVPESYQAGGVRLYRARRFPREWVYEATLIEGSALVDSSIFRVNDRWWMFVQDSPSPRHDRLRLYGAGSLSGPWREHPRSPVVSADPQRARPAGRVVVEGDRIVRFAQDCASVYGLAVRAFVVTTLTEDAYAEHQIGTDPLLGPSGAGWNAHGMHHVDAHRIGADSWIACVDGWFDGRTRSAAT